jgi:serine/threonine protein kinase
MPLKMENVKGDMHRLDHYIIKRKIGQGGMSIVYEAYDKRLKRHVAIKVLHPFLAEKEEYRERFFREAEAVARLAHPNIVQIYDISRKSTKKELYLVTELLEGESLRDFSGLAFLQEVPEIAAAIIGSIALALEHAHKKGIIHRDIKPENIMVSKDGHVKLMDFGIASIGSEEGITQTGTLLGSLAHLAPELIKGNKASVQSDIFSLSTVFYWLVTGKLPFFGNSPHALLRAITDERQENVTRLSSSITDEMAQIIERGLEKDPKKRFLEVHDLIDALDKSLAGMGISIAPKNLANFLREPLKESERLKSDIFQQIRLKEEALRQAGDQKLALALSCRLARFNESLATRAIKAQPRKRSFFLLIVPVTALLAVYYFYFSKPKNNININTNTSELFTEEIQPLISEEIISENRTPETLILAKTNNNNNIKTKEPKPNNTNIKNLSSGQDVNIIIWPFAHVDLDNKRIANDVKSLKLHLDKGKHRLIFSHNYAATVEKILDIKDSPETIELALELIKSKPAFLVVKSSIDADVAVGGNYKGSTEKSMHKPIVIAMPDKSHLVKLEVIIEKEGFVPFIKNVDFVAGQVTEINVDLKSTKKTF